MLSQDEQTAIHSTIAVEMLSSGRVDASQANLILTRAFAGKSEFALVMLAHSVVTADQQTVGLLTEHFTLLPFLTTETPLIAGNAAVSCVLRLAQLKIAAAADRDDLVSKIVDALFKEAESFKTAELVHPSKSLL